MARGLSLATGPAVDASVGYQRWIQQAVPSDRKMASRNSLLPLKKHLVKLFFGEDSRKKVRRS